jgi:prepilin-type N-terminal cleavage/methylation domain-containing protein
MKWIEYSYIVNTIYMRRSAGFSLVELAVVLVIMSLVLTMGLGALNAQMLMGNQSITKKRQEIIKDALISYLGAQKRLPCAEDSSSGGVTGLEECPNTFGTVPFVTLGISRETATDGTGNLFTYAVSSQSPAPNCATTPTAIDWKQTPCFGEGKSGGFVVNDGTFATPTQLTNQAIAVVVSHGSNGLGAYAVQGTRNANPATCEEGQNATLAVGTCSLAANTFYKGERDGNDDVLVFVTSTEAINALVRQGSIKSAAGRVAEDLASVRNQMLSAKAIVPACSTRIAMVPSKPDPWGNNYVTQESNSIACTCSTGGVGVAPTSTAQCATASLPVVCTSALAGEVNATRMTLGLPPC